MTWKCKLGGLLADVIERALKTENWIISAFCLTNPLVSVRHYIMNCQLSIGGVKWRRIQKMMCNRAGLNVLKIAFLP